MNLAITGASGFIGRALLARLAVAANEGPHILRTVALSTSAHGRQRITALFPHVQVKSLAEAGMPGVLDGIDVLMHAGWSTVPSTAEIDPARNMRENVDGGLQLLEAAAKAGVKRFIFLSSGGTVYGVTGHRPLNELQPAAPLQAYGAAKLLFEQHLAKYAADRGFEYLSLRPSNVYGELLAPSKPQGVIEHWLDAIRHDRPVEVWAGTDVVRDYLFIDDLVDVLVASLHRPIEFPVMNIGTGVGTSLVELASLVAEVTGREMRMERTPSGPRGVPYNVLNTDRLQRCFGEREWTALPDGLRKYWARLQRTANY